MSYYDDSTPGKSNFVQDSSDKTDTLPMRVKPQRNIHQQMQRHMQNDHDADDKQVQMDQRLLNTDSYFD